MEKIGGYAFANLYKLTSVEMPAVTSIGEWAFLNCIGFEEIDIPSVEEIWDYAFAGCVNLRTVNARKAKFVGPKVFLWCEDLNPINLDSAEEIYLSAFATCKKVNSLRVESSLSVKIHSDDDRRYTNYIDTLVLKSAKDVVMLANEESRLYDCLDFPSAETITGNLYCNYLNAPSLKDLSDVNFSKGMSHANLNSLTAIGERAFENCGLRYIDISSAQTIGKRAFYNCFFLETVVMSESLKTIEDSAFYCNYDLWEEQYWEMDYLYSQKFSADIPRSVTSIGKMAFMDCTGEWEHYFGTTKLVTVRWETPLAQVAEENFLQRDDDNMINAVLRVPNGCKEKYKTAPVWKNFRWMIEMDEELPYDNKLVAGNLTAKKGSVKEFSMDLNCEVPLYEYSFTLVLPEGVTIAQKSPGWQIWTEETNYNYHLHIEGGGKDNIGNNFDVIGMYVWNNYEASKLKIKAMLEISEEVAEGDYTIKMTNYSQRVNEPSKSTWSGWEIETYPIIGSSYATLTVTKFDIGDVNGDGVTDLSDAIAITYDYLQESPAGYEKKVADVNGDGVVDLSDAISVVYQYLQNNADARRKEEAKEVEANEPQ